MNNYQVIDTNNWKRKVHAAVFKDYLEPSYCITFDLDVTNLLNRIRDKKLSFTLAITHALSKVANSIEEFRYRFMDDQVVLFDQIDTALTYLESESDLFKVINAPYIEDMEAYVKNTEKIIKEQEEYFTGPLGLDIFQCSPLPWINFSHISHTISGKEQNGTIFFDWGKYSLKDGRYIMPLSVQVHHSFVDGVHVARFAEDLQNYLNSYSEESI